MPRPPLWCPLLTRHTAGGGIDTDAMRRHAATLRPHVDGLLMPGSTGDGWQLDDAQTLAVARLGAELAREHGFELLAGAFAPTLDGILARAEIVLGAGAPGIAVCAPHGDLAPTQIEEALENVLALGQPTALYQLPQITGNRIPSDPNFRWFKDRHRNFLYIDRIVIAAQRRGGGRGRAFYADVMSFAEPRWASLCCEVFLGVGYDPALLFHGAFGFREVGQQTMPGTGLRACMLMKDLASHAWIAETYRGSLPDEPWLAPRHRPAPSTDAPGA